MVEDFFVDCCRKEMKNGGEYEEPKQFDELEYVMKFIMMVKENNFFIEVIAEITDDLKSKHD